MVLVQLLSLASTLAALAPEWSPPPNPDPEVILEEARADAAAGRNEDALAKYVWFHNNAVRHGLARRWQEWPWSSAAAFLEAAGKGEAERIWREFPVLDYGEGWDDWG